MRRLLVACVIVGAVWTAPASAAVLAHVVTKDAATIQFTSGTAELTKQLGPPDYVLTNNATHHVTGLQSTASAAGRTTYTFATDESGRTMQLTVQKTHLGVTASWRAVPATDVDHVVVRLAATPAQHFLGGGEQRGAVDLRGQIDTLKVWNICGANAPAPWFMSSAGYGFEVDSSSVSGVSFPGAVDNATFACQWGTAPPCPTASNVEAIQICVRGASLAYRIFGGGLRQLQQQATAVTGRPALPPKSEFELIKWRDSVGGKAQVLDDVAELQSRGIPIGWELLDNPWESCLGSMTFSAKFGDPRQLIRTLAGKGVRLMTWISPLVDPSCGAAAGYPQLITSGSDTMIDLTSATDKAQFEKRLEALLRLGVAGVKGDRGDEIDLEQLNLAGGAGAAIHNTVPALFERATAAAAHAVGISALPSIFRAGWLGSAPLTPGFWGGDQTGNVAGLREAILSAATAGLGGYSTWGSDIGGYDSSNLNANVFVRWSQLGAISPVFEVGGIGPQATFWKFGSVTTNRFKASATLHYELFPELYALARQAHATGIPVLRPLAFEFPGDAAAWTHELELTVGDDLLAAPVDSGVGTLSVPVYLPKGRWVDVFTGGSYAGGRTVQRHTTLADFPLYVRAGAAIRFNLRAPHVWKDPWGTNDLEHAGRVGWLYAPGSSTSAAALHASSTGSTVTLRAPSGAKQVQILVLGSRAPASVTIDGRPTGARDDLRPAVRGWRRQSGQMPGVLLKLEAGDSVRIRYRAG